MGSSQTLCDIRKFCSRFDSRSHRERCGSKGLRISRDQSFFSFLANLCLSEVPMLIARVIILRMNALSSRGCALALRSWFWFCDWPICDCYSTVHAERGACEYFDGLHGLVWRDRYCCWSVVDARRFGALSPNAGSIGIWDFYAGWIPG